MAFSERQLVAAMVDLARFTQAVAGMDSVAIAEVIDRFYTEASAVVTGHGGRVVKYLGDGCLVVFPADRGIDAVDAVQRLARRVDVLGVQMGLELEMGANVHLCTVAEGQFGEDGVYDIVGPGVIHTFRMGAGSGIRISEPIYRKLPSDRRGEWVRTSPQPPTRWPPDEQAAVGHGRVRDERCGGQHPALAGAQRGDG